MTYNTSFLDNSTNIMQVMGGINDNLNGAFAGLLLLIIAVVFFIAMKNYDTEVSLLASSFVTSIVSLFFFIMGWIGVAIFILPIILLMISLFLNIINK